MILSIIIPAYNSEKYICTCLDSVLGNNTLDIECIVVNDGSIDNTEKILCQYAQKDPRLTYITIANHGVSFARNLGIQMSKSDRVLFMDSDDYFLENSWDIISPYLHVEEDIVIFNYLEERHKNRRNAIPVASSNNSFINNIEKFAVYGHYLNSSCGKLYKRNIIIDNNISFPIGIKFAEDSSFVLDYLMNCTSMEFENLPIFIYQLHGTNSINNYSLNRLDDYWRELCIRHKLAEAKLSNIDEKSFYYAYFKMIVYFLVAFFESLSLDNGLVVIDEVRNKRIIKKINVFEISDYCNFYEKIVLFLINSNNNYVVVLFLKLMSLVRSIKKRMI